MTDRGPEDCAFCRVAAGEATTPVVGEWPEAVALVPRTPAVLGHTLVIPRRHVPDLWRLPPAVGGDFWRVVQQLAQAIRVAMRPHGLNLITSAGAAAGQTVFHLHVHLVPRWPGDGFGPIWPAHPKGWDPDRIREVAAAVAAALPAPDGELISPAEGQMRPSGENLV